MTEEMCEVCAVAYEVWLGEERGSERWFAVEPHALPAAHRLCEKGWLHRRIGKLPEWRLSNAGVGALTVTTPPDPCMN